MNRIDKLIPLVRPYYQSIDPAHDWAHIERVAANARELQKNSNTDLEVILAAVYCHDLVNLAKNHPDRAQASTLSANTAKQLLIESHFTEAQILAIQTCISEHSYSKGLKPSFLASAIVQDADRLDALGAIGILRCCSVTTQMQSNFYDPEDPLAENRELNDKIFMLDHYQIKLFKLIETMNTEAARIEAKKRIDFMKNFIEQLMTEIKS